jgi:hypothetical protein
MPKKTLNDVDWAGYSTKTCCIHLEDQDYEGTIPTEIGLLTSLTAGLFLNGNKLTGSIPSQIGILSGLKTDLHLENNMLKV